MNYNADDFIQIQQPIFYYSTYWEHWDVIMGWNKKTGCVVVRKFGTDDIREHCTTMEKNMLSTVILDRNMFCTFKDFIEAIKKESNRAWIIWRDSGLPRKALKFTYNK